MDSNTQEILYKNQWIYSRPYWRISNFSLLLEQYLLSIPCFTSLCLMNNRKSEENVLHVHRESLSDVIESNLWDK